MNGFVTDARLNRAVQVPIAVPQTELRAGTSLVAATISLNQGQRLELRSLTLHVIRLLTTGTLPVSNFDAYGLCTVGLFSGLANCTPLAAVYADSNTSVAANSFRRFTILGPGSYRVLVRNNSANIDLSIAASGSMRIYV